MAGLYDGVVGGCRKSATTTIVTKLAEQLGLDPADDPETLQAQVHDALRGVAGWLLIFDDADQVETVQPWMPAIPMPPGVPGHVLVTTRRGGIQRTRSSP